jgi:glutathione S-transferase
LSHSARKDGNNALTERKIAQRAHNNFTENLTPFLGALLVAGLKHPVLAASLGGAWSFARVMFAIGYTSGGPQGRIV